MTPLQEGNGWDWAGGDGEQGIPTGDLSDEDLVELLSKGSGAALAEVYRRHSGAAHALATGLLTRSGSGPDVVHDVFLLLWTHPHRYERRRGSLRTFILTMTRSRALTVLRSNAARADREVRSARAEPVHLIDAEHMADDTATAELIRDAMTRLPAVQGEAINLAFFAGYTYEEVARRLHRPQGTVNGQIRSGLSNLRDELRSLYD